MADPTYEDFLDAPEPQTPAYAEQIQADGSGPGGRGLATWMSTGAWLLAGLVIGALVVAMLHTNSSTNASGLPAGAPAANQGPAGQLPSGQAPNGQAPNGQIPNGQAPAGAVGGGFRGGLPGEEHIMGTLTAVGPSSVTVKSSGGTATYPIESSTLLIKDGQRVASTSAMKAGDTVVVHVYPANGTTHTEMVIDGVPFGPGFGGHDGDGPDDNTGSSGTTTET